MTAPRNAPLVTEYPLSAALRARLLGVLLALLGVLVFLTALASIYLHWRPWVLGALAVVVAALVVGGGSLLARRWYVVRTDSTGYKVRFVPNVGSPSARWTDVEDMLATTVAGTRCLVLRLKSGSTTTIPVEVLAADPNQLASDFRELLNRHG